MEFGGNLRQALIAKTLRVPALTGPAGDASAVARQLDVALLSVGFKCSRELLVHLAAQHPVVARQAGEVVVAAVRERVGDHVEHNSYFVRFPRDVPDTLDFWVRCIADALTDPRSASNVAGQLSTGVINLLDLPRYGRYQHTYEELLAAHDELVPALEDRLTLLHLGRSLVEESHALYVTLAGRGIPLSEPDLALLATLADLHVNDAQPDEIPVRENRAIVNRSRLRHGLTVDVDTPVDVLRLACALSDGDVSLRTPTWLRSLPRAQRRALLAALDGVVRESPGKLADVARFAEPFKRLGERLHPHEYPRWDAAREVFAVARGERKVRSLAARVELALADGRVDQAIADLSHAPGMHVRAVDRLLRAGAEPVALAEALRAAAPAVSTRVLLSLREHLLNRDEPGGVRVFVNQGGRAWVTADAREPLNGVAALDAVLDGTLTARMPRVGRLLVDPAIRTVAVPLSGKARPDGLGILPRGSLLALGERVRFFVYWKERAQRTDYDLSVVLLDDEFRSIGWVSYTNLKEHGIVHSGDITESPAGASEFIDLDLAALSARYVVPQVNVYAGEGFDAVEEVFFGWMQRTGEQEGRPFEPRLVRAKSELFGAGRVSLPVLFERRPGGWRAKWMHLNLTGRPHFNQVEANRLSTSLLVRGIAERRYLQVDYLESLLYANGAVAPEPGSAEPVTFVGLERPEELPAGSTAFTPANLHELLSSA